MPEPSTIEVISSADGRLPASVSVDGQAHRVTAIVREWQVRGEHCFDVELADGRTAIVCRDRSSGRWRAVDVRGLSRPA